MPGAEELVAVVEHVGAVVRLAAVSPLTKPEYEGVMAGTAPPWGIDCEEAVIFSAAGWTVTEPAT